MARFEVADVLTSIQGDWPVENRWKQRTLWALVRCRTAAMGGHVYRCDAKGCGRMHISYNSCRNRHCPKCQGHLQQDWIRAREQELIKTQYFHVVFTLPSLLNELALHHPAYLYSTLFKTAWSVISDFAANPKFLGARTGMTAVLHTWGQNLSLHPHLHCIVPAGGVTPSGKWKSLPSQGIPGSGKARYLFPVKAMSTVFRARMVEALRKEGSLEKADYQTLFKKPWVVYAKQPFFSPKQVIEYLGRYTHKIAISNHRLQRLKDGKVSFSMKDYRHGGRKTTCQLDSKEFVRRFALHILPKGFTRIRHYGILSSTLKAKCLVIADRQLGVVVSCDRPPSQLLCCPYCKKGKLQVMLRFDQRGPPMLWREQLQ